MAAFRSHGEDRITFYLALIRVSTRIEGKPRDRSTQKRKGRIMLNEVTNEGLIPLTSEDPPEDRQEEGTQILEEPGSSLLSSG
jgi:hypothetical protein